MQKVEDYRKHANECHAMARCWRSPKERDMLLNMVPAAVDDRLPHGTGGARDAPVAWSRQQQMLGFAH